MSYLMTYLFVDSPGSVIAFAFDDSFILFPLDKATMAPSSLVKIEDGLCRTVQGPGQNSSVCTIREGSTLLSSQSTIFVIET